MDCRKCHSAFPQIKSSFFGFVHNAIRQPDRYGASHTAFIIGFIWTCSNFQGGWMSAVQEHCGLHPTCSAGRTICPGGIRSHQHRSSPPKTPLGFGQRHGCSAQRSLDKRIANFRIWSVWCARRRPGFGQEGTFAQRVTRTFRRQIQSTIGRSFDQTQRQRLFSPGWMGAEQW